MTKPGWRGVNGAVSALIVCFLIAHALLGCLSLLFGLPKTFAASIWLGVALASLHVLLCVATSKLMLGDQERPPSKKKRRHLLLKWLSGAALAAFAALHVLVRPDGLLALSRPAYTAALLALVAALAAHVFIGSKSLLKDLGLARRLRTPLRLAVGLASAACAVILAIWCFQQFAVAAQ
jgi:succinate dehydrogenase hydrophobic anchor subunit